MSFSDGFNAHFGASKSSVRKPFRNEPRPNTFIRVGPIGVSFWDALWSQQIKCLEMFYRNEPLPNTRVGPGGVFFGRCYNLRAANHVFGNVSEMNLFRTLNGCPGILDPANQMFGNVSVTPASTTTEPRFQRWPGYVLFDAQSAFSRPPLEFDTWANKTAL